MDSGHALHSSGHPAQPDELWRGDDFTKTTFQSGPIILCLSPEKIEIPNAKHYSYIILSDNDNNKFIAKPNIIICCKIKYFPERFLKSFPVKPFTNLIIVSKQMRYWILLVKIVYICTVMELSVIVINTEQPELTDACLCLDDQSTVQFPQN